MEGRIAEAYCQTRTNFAISTTPTRRVEFRGCHATIRADVDVIPVLRTPGIVVEFSRDFVDWVPGWMRGCGAHKPPQAEVQLPNGLKLGPAPDYELIRPPTAVEEPIPIVGDGDDVPDLEPELVEAAPKKRGRPPKGW